jgi:hypothetical protein
MVFAVNKVALGQGFLRVLRFYRHHHTTVVLHTHDQRGDEQQARWLPQFRTWSHPIDMNKVQDRYPVLIRVSFFWRNLRWQCRIPLCILSIYGLQLTDNAGLSGFLRLVCIFYPVLIIFIPAVPPSAFVACSGTVLAFFNL